ncbi:MAG: 30S ribosomal protein S9 [Candidatus Komeilibacteria bacterium]|nr:30S ribosomal protein S9 [Candidatus Komeilibacteria bacterium]
MAPKKHDFVSAIGRRKGAIARVRMSAKPVDTLTVTVNGRDFKDYFNYFDWQNSITGPLTLTGMQNRSITALVNGGGIKAQADAMRLGISRALLLIDAELRATLKKAGYLTRDPRIKERKKPGLKRARRAPQWSKR